jgi:hypothetical protein
MADNQIVTSIVNNTENFHGVVGERYIIEIDGKKVISEYNGNVWMVLPQNNEPKYIFVSNAMKTIILHEGVIWDNTKWFICSTCQKITIQRMKYSGGIKGMSEICVHCFFKKNHDNPNKKEYDHHPLTIGKYIHKYARSHRMDKCSDQKKCFLCDYRSGKLLLDINDRNIIYTGKLIDLLQKTSIDITI